MELSDFFSLDGLTLGGVIGSLIAALIWLVFLSFMRFTLRHLLFTFKSANLFTTIRQVRFSFWLRYTGLVLSSSLVAFLLWPGLNEAFSVGARGGFSVLFALATVLISAVWRDWVFAFTGIAGAERTVSSGTDYEASLRLCSKSLSFMGTGAYKLTNNGEFEPAVARCMTSGGTVRILMSRPDVMPLQLAERMANVDPGDYSSKVRSTLKKLRALKRDRAYPIEVRFHNRENATRMQEFRMMFIDEQYLLLSFNLYGHGDGTTFPQLVLNRQRKSRPLMSFYQPFYDSFERVWKSSTKWDFNEYL